MPRRGVAGSEVAASTPRELFAPENVDRTVAKFVLVSEAEVVDDLAPVLRQPPARPCSRCVKANTTSMKGEEHPIARGEPPLGLAQVVFEVGDLVPQRLDLRVLVPIACG
jgi:hypothetical protein